jgi:hypothetical protein
MALPILIHLLTRRRFKRIRWAAMEFLIEAQRRNRRRLRMEEWILLALRCLAFALAGLMFGRLYLTPSSVAAGLGGLRRTERVFVIDDSFSMGYQPAGSDRTPIARAKLAVRRLIDTIRSESQADTVTVLRTSAIHGPIAERVYPNQRQTEELNLRLEAVAASQHSLDAGDVIEGVADLLNRSPDVAGAVVYIISDFQVKDWVPKGDSERKGSGPASGAAEGRAASKGGLFDPLLGWAGRERGLRLVLIQVGEREPANTAVLDLGLVSAQTVAGSLASLRASLANYSPQAVRMGLDVTVGNVPQPAPVTTELAAGQTANLEWEVPFPRPGFELVRAQMPPDALPIDNTRYLAVDVLHAIRILIVNGEPSSDAYEDETTFLTTALRPPGDLFSGNELEVIDETELPQVNLAGFHLVILANVYRVSEAVAESLGQFVRAGGGILVFVGDQVDVELYNATLYRNGTGWLPARFNEIAKPANAVHWVVTDRRHPALRGVSREGDPLGLGGIPFFQFMACEPAAGPSGATEQRAEEEPASSEAEARDAARESEAEPDGAARVVVRFDDPLESPAVIERRFGLGRVVLVTTTADKEWNLWADHPTYLPIITELAHQVARRADREGDIRVGSPIELSVDPAEFESEGAVRTPGYPAEAEFGVKAAPAPNGRGLQLRWEHTDAAGFYQFVLRRREGGEEERVVTVNLDPGESDLSPAKETDLRRAHPNLRFDYMDGIDQLGGMGGETRTEFWRALLFVAAAVLMTEQVLAFYWGRRR